MGTTVPWVAPVRTRGLRSLRMLLVCLALSGTLPAATAWGQQQEAPPARNGQPVPARPEPTPPPSSSKVPAAALRAECQWVGKRTIAALLRDDLIAAQGFLDVYARFQCPVPHVASAFGCAAPLAAATEARNAPPATTDKARDRELLIHLCWITLESLPTSERRGG